jgi:hypothetical protein
MVLCLWVLSLFNNTAVAMQLSAEVLPQTIELKSDKGYSKVTIAGNFDQDTNLVAKISGPKKSYRIVEKERRYGIWVATTPKFVFDISSYCQVLSFKSMETSIVSGSLSDLLCIQDYHGDRDIVIDKLKKLRLYLSEIEPIERVGNGKYRLEFTIPATSASGDYEVDILGFNRSQRLVAQKSIKFTVNKELEVEYIKELAKKYPVLYVITVILFAIMAGIIAGCSNGIRKNNL